MLAASAPDIVPPQACNPAFNAHTPIAAFPARGRSRAWRASESLPAAGMATSFTPLK
jgi:hypothetical protein